MPEAHTLLIVSEPTCSGIPTPSDTWRDGMWPAPAWMTWPKIDVLDLLRLDPGALERAARGDLAELDRGHRREAAADLREGRARSAEDDRGHARSVSAPARTMRRP